MAHDPRTCSVCGVRDAREAVKKFLTSLSEPKQTMSETEPNRRALDEELQRLRTRIRTLEAQVGETGHDDLTDHRSQAEIVMDQAEDRAKRERAGRRRQDNSREAIRVFKENAHTRRTAGEF